MVMNHIVTLDPGTNELESLLTGTKTMIIRGSDVKCIPYGIVSEGDVLYFVSGDNCTEVKAKGVVSSVYNSYALSVEESFEMIIRNQDKLVLPDDQFYRWAGKRYLVLIGLQNVEIIRSFNINKNSIQDSEGWLTSEKLDKSVSQKLKTA